MVGQRVTRGPAWHWGEQDAKGPGTVVAVNDGSSLVVEWDNGHKNVYRWDLDSQVFDLALSSDTITSRPDVVKELWGALMALHEAVDKVALGDVSLSKPQDMQGFYNVLAQYEGAIAPAAQEDVWLSRGKRELWLAEVRGPECDASHAARCLLTMERHIKPTSLKPEWGSKGKEWSCALEKIGGGGDLGLKETKPTTKHPGDVAMMIKPLTNPKSELWKR
eukprot:m51a1_g13122 hypothetical protein (220) ;mRNA; f:292-1141